MKIIIDRFEGDFAVAELENRETVALPKAIIPENAKEGSVLSITCDLPEEEARRKEIKAKMDSLFGK